MIVLGIIIQLTSMKACETKVKCRFMFRVEFIIDSSSHNNTSMKAYETKIQYRLF